MSHEKKKKELETFDDLMDELSGTGLYQNLMLYAMLVPVFFIVPFVFLHQIYVLHVPNHWCKAAPQASSTALNLSMDEWKDLMLPKEIGPDLLERASQCQMYAVENASELQKFLANSTSDWPLQKCEFGYDYDKSSMESTAVTDNDWVCDYGARATNLFTWGIVGIIVGAIVLSFLADCKGRKFPFFICTLLTLVFSLASIGFSHVYFVYVLLKFLAYACMMPLFQSPLNITTELSTTGKRGIVIGAACIAWSLGNMLMPLLAYLLNSWKILRVACILPILTFLVMAKMVPESPRWLMSKGRVDEATAIICKIAKTNRIETNREYVRTNLQRFADKSAKEVNLGYISLFLSSRLLAFRTMLVTMGYTASGFVYYQLMINIGNMAGNIFWNLFFLGLVEGPGCILGVTIADKFGRRWTHFAILALNALLFLSLAFIVMDPNLKTLVIIVCMAIKFNISATFVLAYVQAMEIFPTCVRQSGLGFATFVSQSISIAGPYVVYLGATDLRLPYMVMCAICAIGATAVLHLPETLDAEMPESLAEAANFGGQDKFFSYKPRRHHGIDAGIKKGIGENESKMSPEQIERLVLSVQHRA